MECSICGALVANQKGLAAHFRHQSTTHPDYKTWIDDQKWADKTEGANYVRCLMPGCTYRATTLARHLKAVHEVTAGQYRDRFGQDTLIRCGELTAKRSNASKNREGGFGKGETKEIKCPDCGVVQIVSKFFAPEMHNPRCPTCDEKRKAREEEARWEGKTEPEDFVTCQVCGLRAESLVSHLQNSHPELIGTYYQRFPNSPLVSLGSGVRDKSKLKGRQLSPEVRAKMSENAGKWNKGLTKDTDSRVAEISKKRKGQPSWSKGLTKENHPSLQSLSDKLRKYIGDNRPWDNGLRVVLDLDDFKPFLDEEGRVDRRKATEELGASWHTIFKCMKELSLRTSKKYDKARSEAQIIRLREDQLIPFAMKNGKISVLRAHRALGHAWSVVKRECLRLRLPVAHTNLTQNLFLELVSEILGVGEYIEEWAPLSCTNPDTGGRLRFDGFFASFGLVVEFHGHQHWMFPSAWVTEEKEYLKLRRRDRVKKEWVGSQPNLVLLEVREDEPFDDPSYLRGRLFQLGVLSSKDLPVPEDAQPSVFDLLSN